MLEYFPFLLALGTMIFNYAFGYACSHAVHIIDFISIAITSINFIFPMDKLNKILFPTEDIDNIHYEDYYKARF